ncbi:MAG: hypothetical protein ACYCZN_01525 [Candidatus Dormibacteria bacterium]
MSEASFHEATIAAARADVAAAARRGAAVEEHDAVLSLKGNYLCGFRFRDGHTCSGHIGTPSPDGRMALAEGLGVQPDGAVTPSRHLQRNLRTRKVRGPLVVDLPIAASCPVCGRRCVVRALDRSRADALSDLAWERFHEAIGRAHGNEESDPAVGRACTEYQAYQDHADAVQALEQEWERNG